MPSGPPAEATPIAIGPTSSPEYDTPSPSYGTMPPPYYGPTPSPGWYGPSPAPPYAASPAPQRSGDAPMGGGADSNSQTRRILSGDPEGEVDGDESGVVNGGGVTHGSVDGAGGIGVVVRRLMRARR